MAHSLEQKISRVRRQARRLLVGYALGWTAAVLAVTLVALGLADYWIRFEDPGIRLMCSLLALAVFGWTVQRFWLQSLGRSLGDLEIAGRVERYFPRLADRLTSTIEFLKQPEVDVQAGSLALRRSVILETTAAAEELDFASVLERRPALRALTVGGVALALAAVLVLLAPGHARIALARLARPFGADAWPRVYNLAFRATPTRLAAGETFEVELLSDAEHRVPDDVRIQYRYELADTETENVESEAMQWLNGALVARKESVSRPFYYRAEGGDDRSMEWIRLEVVEPPRVETLHLTLHPPDYTGLPIEPSPSSIHALVGTRVALEGTSTKKLRAATIHTEGGGQWTAALTADAHGFSLAADAAEPFIVDKSGTYWIALEDESGLVGGAAERFEIRAVADQAPTLTVEKPAANIFVTPQGTVPLKIVTKDDLAIRDVALHFSRSDNAEVEDFTVELHRGSERAATLSGEGLLGSGRLGESHTLEHRWPLAELSLQPGTQLTMWATAGDYKPQTGKSTVRRLSIISSDELEERLAQRQMLIFGELQRALKLQQDARTQTKSLDIQLEQVGRLAKPDVDRAQAAELNQRQIARTLTSSTEGIPAQIGDFLSDLENNRVDSPDMQRRMSAIADELNRLGQDDLRTIERELTGMIKAAQADLASNTTAARPDASQPGQTDTAAADPAAARPAADRPAVANPPDPAVQQSLAAAGQGQDRVVNSLEQMIDELRQWDNYRRFAREVAQLQSAQEEITAATKQIAQKTLGRDAKELDPQQQADLRKLAQSQSELSRRLEKAQQQMAEMAASLEQSDPLAASAIKDGLHHAQQRATSGAMRQAGERIDNNQLAHAAGQQAQISKDLEEMLSILSNRREQELARLVEQLREAERQMTKLRQQQAGLRKQLSEAARQADSEQAKQQLKRLSRQQQQLQEEAARLARRLERLQADAAGQSTSSASGKMGEAGGSAEQGDSAGAEQQSAEAEKDLEDAQQQLAERRRQAEADLAREQLARLEDSLRSLHTRQQKLTAETERLEKLRALEGKFSRAQASTIHDLARQQKMLETETSLLAEKLSLAEVIHLALDGAARQMAQAVGLLERQRTGSQTQTAQEAARLRFAQLLAALENKSKNKPGEQGDGGAGGAGGAPAAGRQDGAQVLTQLKLLKILQEDLNSRFRTINGDNADAAASAQQLAEIAAEQGKLAELALKLSEPPEDNPEDNPESLPDVREGQGDADRPDAELAPPLEELLKDIDQEPKP
ncbi:MAG: hypothetical protein AB7O59_04920 [Pirellulales bacterium]